jgi:hypothetical protein
MDTRRPKRKSAKPVNNRENLENVEEDVEEVGVVSGRVPG